MEKMTLFIILNLLLTLGFLAVGVVMCVLAIKCMLKYLKDDKKQQ